MVRGGREWVGRGGRGEGGVRRDLSDRHRIELLLLAWRERDTNTFLQEDTAERSLACLQGQGLMFKIRLQPHTCGSDVCGSISDLSVARGDV